MSNQPRWYIIENRSSGQPRWLVRHVRTKRIVGTFASEVDARRFLEFLEAKHGPGRHVLQEVK